MDSTVLIFNPPPHAVPDIIEDLCDPDLSMKDIAHEQQTTFAALVAWMARPDIRSQIRNFRSSSIERCKLIADNYLPIILKTCVRLINEYNDDESNRLYHPSNWNRPEQQRRNLEAARKTLYLMLRLHSLQLDEPVVHSDPSRKRTRYQPIEAAQDRDRGLESIAIRPQTLPISAVPSPRTPEPTPSPAPITEPARAAAPPASTPAAPTTEPAPVSSSPTITPTTPSATSESPSESSVDLLPSSPEAGPSTPIEPYSTDDLLTELTSDHPELAQAATAVKALLNNSYHASTRTPIPETRDPPPPPVTRITNIVDHLLRTFSDDPDEAIERAKQRDHEPAKQELTNSS